MAPLDPLSSLVLGSGLLAVLVVTFWPGWGLVARRRRAGEFMSRVFREDALKHLYTLELQGRRPTLQSLAGTLELPLHRASEVLAALHRSALVQMMGEEMRLTPAGRRYAVNILRAHRLWEQHLAEKTGVDESEWHRMAERQEHLLSPEDADTLAAALGHPAYDPHGDPIPTAEGELAPGDGRALGTLGPQEWGRVLHIEDEPESVCAQVRAMGLYPGTLVRLLETSDRRVRIWANGEEQVLAPVVAASVTVRPAASAVEETEATSQPLSTLRAGQSARVTRLSPRCRGAERRRLLDFGILPGTRIAAELHSPAGRLTAYRVRETLIALREDQAAWIYVRPEAAAEA